MFGRVASGIDDEPHVGALLRLVREKAGKAGRRDEVVGQADDRRRPRVSRGDQEEQIDAIDEAEEASGASIHQSDVFEAVRKPLEILRRLL